MRLSKTISLLSNASMEEDNQESKIDSKLQNRQKNFNNEVDFEYMKEKNMTQELSSSQNNRTKILSQRRLKQNLKQEITESLATKISIDKEWYEYCNKLEINLSKFTEVISAFRSQDLKQKFLGLTGLRKLLVLKNAPIQEIIDEGVVPEIISLLDNSPPEFQYESLWCLTNIATGTISQVNYIVSKGCIPRLMKCLESPIEELKIQSVWVIGNIVTDSYKYREIFIKDKIFDKILVTLASTNNKSVIKQFTYSVHCFFKVYPIPEFSQVEKSIKIIARVLLLLPDDKEFLEDALPILSFMTDNYNQSIAFLIELNLISHIINFLNSNYETIQLFCLKIIGNIASGNANQTQLLIDNNILNYLAKTIFSKNKKIVKETSWIISNIAAGTKKQIQTLISMGFLKILSEINQKEEEEIKNECLWAICNLTSVEDKNFMQILLDQGILEIICNFLKNNDAKKLGVCIEALCNLLEYGKEQDPNPIAIQIEKLGMCDIIENLQNHPVDYVYEKVFKMMIKYFKVEYVV